MLAVRERPSLLGATDDQLFRVASEEHRAVVTYDIPDYRTLVWRCLVDEDHHFGLVLLHPTPFPQGREFVGRVIQALEALLTDMAAEDALADRELWLG